MRATNAKAALQKFHITAARGGAPSLVHVMDDEENICYHVPAIAAQVPSTLQCAVKLRLCRNMATTGHCDFGTKCMFVHVHPDVLKHCERSQVHTNFAWKSLEEVPYTRHEAGSVFHVMKPKGKQAAEAPCTVASERVLVTRGSLDYEARATMMLNLSQNSSSPVDTKIQPSSICAHYYINRCCRLGSSCHFIHVANVDQSAAPGKKAKKRASLPTNGDCSSDVMSLLSPRSSDLDFLSDSESLLLSPRESDSLAASSTGYYVHNPYPSMSFQQLGLSDY